MPVHPLKSEQKLGEHARLLEAREGTAPWRQWDPYLGERQWGAVREDYSEHGTAWDYFRPRSRSGITRKSVDRVGYSDHVRFRGYLPFTGVPAYNLPVYASQRPLPDATQDLVRGCSLGFAAAAISGD